MFRQLISAGRRAAIKSKVHTLLMHHPPLESRCIIRANDMGLKAVLDVGANHGQFASRIRALGWKGEILSFEPLADPFKSLEHMSSKDPLHRVFPFGLGEKIGDSVMNVASNHGASSSLLEFDPLLEESFSITKTANENVVIQRLDEIADELRISVEDCLLKIDTQGFEQQVLNGCGELLERLNMLFLEVSLRPVYVDEPRIYELLGFLDSHGFEVRDLEPSVFEAPSRPLQCDILCLKKGAS